MRSFLKTFAMGALLAACFLLSGCMTASERAALDQKYAFSKSYSLKTDALSAVSAQAFFRQERGFGISTSHCSFGGFIFVERAVSEGRPLPVQRKGGGLFGIRPKTGSCDLPEMSELTLSPDQFSLAAQHGFTFTLIGSRGVVEGNVPAAAFQEVFAKAGKGQPIAAWLPKRDATATPTNRLVAAPSIKYNAPSGGIIIKM